MRRIIPRLWLLVLILSCAFARAQDAPWTPKPNSSEREAIINTLREPVERELKQKVVFRIRRLNVQNGWPFLEGVPQQPGGKPVNYTITPHWNAIEAGAFDDSILTLLRKDKGGGGSSSMTSVRQTIRRRIGSRSTKRRQESSGERQNASDVEKRSQTAPMQSFSSLLQSSRLRSAAVSPVCPLMMPIIPNKALSELNSFGPIRACRPWRVLRGKTWLVGILILLLVPNAFAQADFSTFWKKFRSAVIAGDKATVAEMTKFPLSMPYLQKAVNNKEDFLRRYNEMFKGEANAPQCFKSAEPDKESDRRYGIYCPFKDTPNDWENAPIRFIFELTKSGWKFVGLDNVNE